MLKTISSEILLALARNIVIAVLFLIMLFLPYTLFLTFGNLYRGGEYSSGHVAHTFVFIIDAYHAPYKKHHR